MQVAVRRLLMLATLVAGVSPAGAAVDLTGTFRTELTVIGVTTPPIVCSLAFTQTGSVLDGTGSCGPLTGLVLTGSINNIFGTFSLSGSVPFVCPTLSITGIAAGNSASFSSFYSCSDGIIPLAGTLNGTRCGNGLLDALETCDDGNVTSGDCCSATCQLESSAAPCATDDNPCTTDHCDGAGACLHTNNTLPCDDGLICTSGDTCSVGSCHGAFIASGTSCDDGNPCTPNDTCDGAGTCIPAGTLDCGPCMECADGVGCTAEGLVPITCRRPVEAKSVLQMKNNASPEKDQANWKYTKGAATVAGDFGSPTTTTGYRLCIYEQSTGSGYDRAIFGVEVPAGNGWKQTASGFKFKSKTGDVRGVVLKAGIDGRSKITLKAKGATIGLPPMPIDLSTPILVQLQAGSGTCWQSEHATAVVNTPAKLNARFGSASGAFVD